MQKQLKKHRRYGLEQKSAILTNLVEGLNPMEFWGIYNKIDQVDKKRDLILTRAFYDLQFFAEFFMGHHLTNSFNEFHLDWFKEFNPEEKRVKKNRLAPRGCAKTTLVALIDVLHRICYATEPFTIIFSSVEPMARDKLKDIKSEILGNERLQNFFDVGALGSRLLSEEMEIYSIFGETKIMSKGFLSQIRGLKWGNTRPSRFVFDDITHGERVFSEEQREKAERQFFSDIHNAGTPDTNYINIGTVIHENDLTKKLEKNPLWETKIYRSIIDWPKNEELWQKFEKIMSNIEDPDREKKADKFYMDNKAEMDKASKVMWPQREPLLFLRKEIINIGRKAFNSEKQMMPFLSGESLFQNITWYDDEDYDFNCGLYEPFYALDPATGERKKTSNKNKKLSDSSRIIVYRHANNDKLFVHRDWTNRDSPSKVIEEMYHLHEKYNFLRMGVEANLFRDLYRESIQLIGDKVRKEQGIVSTPPIYELYQKEVKEKRIYTIEPLVNFGRIAFSKSLSSTAKDQLAQYPYTSKNDFLDAVEIAAKITSRNHGFQAINLKFT